MTRNCVWTSLETIIDTLGIETYPQAPTHFTLVAMDEHQSMWCSIFLIIPSFSMASSSCCSLLFRCILHVHGASIDGFASGFSNRVALPLKLPMRLNCSGNCQTCVRSDLCDTMFDDVYCHYSYLLICHQTQYRWSLDINKLRICTCATDSPCIDIRSSVFRSISSRLHCKQ